MDKRELPNPDSIRRQILREITGRRHHPTRVDASGMGSPREDTIAKPQLPRFAVDCGSDQRRLIAGDKGRWEILFTGTNQFITARE